MPVVTRPAGERGSARGLLRGWGGWKGGGMERTGDSPERGRALQEAGYRKLQRAFAACAEPVYRIRDPWLAPCTLAEGHTVDGSLQSLTLAYGSWDTGQPHLHITTWRDLPGQDFEPDAAAEFPDTPGEEITVGIDGRPAEARLLRSAGGAWLLRADPGRVHLLAFGRGPMGDLAFERLVDITPVIDARRSFLASRRRGR